MTYAVIQKDMCGVRRVVFVSRKHREADEALHAMWEEGDESEHYAMTSVSMARAAGYTLPEEAN